MDRISASVAETCTTSFPGRASSGTVSEYKVYKTLNNTVITEAFKLSSDCQGDDGKEIISFWPRKTWETTDANAPRAFKSDHSPQTDVQTKEEPCNRYRPRIRESGLTFNPQDTEYDVFPNSFILNSNAYAKI